MNGEALIALYREMTEASVALAHSRALQDEDAPVAAIPVTVCPRCGGSAIAATDDPTTVRCIRRCHT